MVPATLFKLAENARSMTRSRHDQWTTYRYKKGSSGGLFLYFNPKKEKLRRLREQLHKIGRKTHTKVTTRAEHPHASSSDYTALGPSYTRSPNPVVLTPRTRRRTHNILALEGEPDVARALNACQPWGRCPSRDTANLEGNPSTPACTPFDRRWEHAFPHPEVILELTQRSWANSTPTEPKDPDGDSRGFSEA
ncbi:hypothetical protein BHE74_00004528 [Ensete ventricosum]|nr:hypothetical protein BHE74_00004528 [Ensete ventricosum]